ncbi:hypothetical protein CC86DRAFT_46170 [Ophiobolus disseminans]|uniref:Uncharacterized protein n=1 Tax=Ophiobolus disseminans TaxID=1469910 RepID=A0A6A6ZUH1_9PLEO|nr:hypothetical protein CC86DRAFT_46170 [Ophiobolus disseminans]
MADSLHVSSAAISAGYFLWLFGYTFSTRPPQRIQQLVPQQAEAWYIMRVSHVILKSLPLSLLTTTQDITMTNNTAHEFRYMRDEPPTIFHRFSALPPELRLMIVEAITDNIRRSNCIDANEHAQILSTTLLDLLRVRKEFSGDIKKSYYGRNKFSVTGGAYNHMTTVRAMLRHPRQETAELIKNLSVTIDSCFVHNTLEDMFMNPSSRWRLILAPTRELVAANQSTHGALGSMPTPHDTAWQNDFTNLETLEVIILVWPIENSSSTCRYDDADWSRLDGLLAHTKILLKAR